MKLQGKAIVWHRWLGIATCLLFLVWYVSGIAMMYARMPVLDPALRLERLPPLDAGNVRLSVAEAWAQTGQSGSWKQAHLTTITGRPAYRFLTAGGDRVVSFADQPSVRRSFSLVEATASLRNFVPDGQAFRWLGVLDAPDQWTVQRLYTEHLPLYHAALDDTAQTEIYLSSRTGEVILQTDRQSRMLAWLSAIPHWIYLRAIRVFADEWRWGVIFVSFVGSAMALLGIVVGIWRYSPARKYRNRELGPQPTPYTGAKKWHHYSGLVFGVLTLTFAFSGALSLNPGRWSTGSAPTAKQANAFSGGPLRPQRFSTVPALPPGAKELEFAQVAGSALYRTHSQPWRTLDGRVFAAPSQDQLLASVRAAVGGAAITSVRLLHSYETYYYDRKYRKPLPVLEVKCNDAAQTWFYVDPATGLPVNRYEWSGRWERWAYHGLHSLDFPGLWQIRPLWDVVVIVVSLGGIYLSWTGVQIGWQRIRPRRRTVEQPVRQPAFSAGD